MAPFPAGPGTPQQASRAGSGDNPPRWRKDGKELFYTARDNLLMAAQLDTKGVAFDVKNVEPLFGPVVGGYDVSDDGRKFLTAVRVTGWVAVRAGVLRVKAILARPGRAAGHAKGLRTDGAVDGGSVGEGVQAPRRSQPRRAQRPDGAGRAPAGPPRLGDRSCS